MVVRHIERSDAAKTVALLDLLRVSLFGLHSQRLYRTLIDDVIAHRVDGRIAAEGDDVIGVVLTAPAAYWRDAILRHWRLGFDAIVSRLTDHSAAAAPDGGPPASASTMLDPTPPPRTWQKPGDASRVIFVGTAPAARGRGVGAELYRSVMRDHSLVARIARDNVASLRLHRSLGWKLYPDGGVVLAVYERTATAAR